MSRGAAGRAARTAMAGQRVVRRDRRRIARRHLVAGGLAGLGLAAAVVAAGLWLPRLDVFRIAVVDVRVTPEGGRVPREAVLDLARVRTGGLLLALDLDTVADRVGRHPWVDAVVVRRELPDRLVIEVRERQPAAIVRLDRLYFADAAGRIFKPVERGEEADVPIVTGFTAAALAADPGGVAARLVEGLRLLETAEARLPVAVSELHVDPARGFILRTVADEGLTLVVGEAPFGPKVGRLERILDYLAATGEAAERVDLTLGSRAVVRLRVPRRAGAWRTTGAPAEPTDPGAPGTRPLPGGPGTRPLPGSPGNPVARGGEAGAAGVPRRLAAWGGSGGRPGNSVARGGEAGEAEASRGGPPRGGSTGPSWVGQPRSGSGSRSESL